MRTRKQIISLETRPKTKNNNHDIGLNKLINLYTGVHFRTVMMMMKLPILPCAEKLELVLSTAPRT